MELQCSYVIWLVLTSLLTARTTPSANLNVLRILPLLQLNYFFKAIKVLITELLVTICILGLWQRDKCSSIQRQKESKIVMFWITTPAAMCRLAKYRLYLMSVYSSATAIVRQRYVAPMCACNALQLQESEPQTGKILCSACDSNFWNNSFQLIEKCQ